MKEIKRPNPDEILSAVEAHARAAGRGSLKIFFGSSAGVGKTYAMLQAAKKIYDAGVDVMIGVVETHGRPETLALVEGLPYLPMKHVTHKGVTLQEFDLDKALERKPALILMDELAHSNAPGSRHAKRWQDVEELVDSGIDVYTTLNVQHLEGFNDVVGNITGVNVHETIPDSFFDEADEIQLVDIPTEELLDRLQSGKVYIAEGAAERAAQNFFNKTNLMSLREMALRRTAEHVDADTDIERIQAGLFTPNVAGDRVLVCIGPDKLAAKLVRSGWRLAKSLKAPWYVITVDDDRMDLQDEEKKRVRRALQIAEQHDAQINILQEENIGESILDYARSKGITKIVMGRNIRTSWERRIYTSLVEYIISHSGDIDVYVITGTMPRRKRSWQLPRDRQTPLSYLYAVGLSALCTAVGYSLGALLKPADVIMIYLIGIVISAARFGRFPALLSALVSVVSLNFFFINPLYTLSVADASYWFTFLVMLATSAVISSQASKLRAETLRARGRERETQMFYALTREMVATREKKDLLALTLKHLGDALEGRALIWIKQDDGRLDVKGGEPEGDRLKEESVADWATQHKQSAGMGTNTLPAAQAYYQPVLGIAYSYGVISYTPSGEKSDISESERDVLETFASLLASSLDRITAAHQAENLRIDNQAENVRNTLLSSMSHDLRTPLAAIRGSVETLIATDQDISGDTRQALLKSIGDQADRLTRVMNNLLDMTRLETGQINIRSENYYLPELIGSALGHLQATLKNHRMMTFIPDNLPMVSVDAILFEQVLQNLLENAASFSPPGSSITIHVKVNHKGLLISVADEGTGIPDGMERHIFEKFYTIGRKDRASGAGLGLAICRAIIESHGGKIWAEKKNLGQKESGATIHILLPPARLVKDNTVQEDEG
ncbi:MAG: sensor histidine kinase KdpD [Pseudobdellovibrionaceae bacterium]